MPHQKLVVIDGLFAFKGSANLTLPGWRKSARGRDLVEIVTDVDEVIALHNRFFARLWGELSAIGESVPMYDTINIPF
jgi:phosphatidylserine/phosphatidylglycerophosphate/cardiolipin synthase-like enzyme